MAKNKKGFIQLAMDEGALRFKTFEDFEKVPLSELAQEPPYEFNAGHFLQKDFSVLQRLGNFFAATIFDLNLNSSRSITDLGFFDTLLSLHPPEAQAQAQAWHGFVEEHVASPLSRFLGRPIGCISSIAGIGVNSIESMGPSCRFLIVVDDALKSEKAIQEAVQMVKKCRGQQGPEGCGVIVGVVEAMDRQERVRVEMEDEESGVTTTVRGQIL